MSILTYCNALVPIDSGVISLGDHRLCKHPPKWKVTYKYGVKYYCTLHKNLYSKNAIKIEVMRLNNER